MRTAPAIRHLLLVLAAAWTLAAPLQASVVHPADADLSGDLTAEGIDALAVRWRGGEEGLLDALTGGYYILRNGGCYFYNPATGRHEPRSCEPVVASPPVHYVRENVRVRPTAAPAVTFYRAEPRPLKAAAPPVLFYRAEPRPLKAAAPPVLFHRADPRPNKAAAPPVPYYRELPNDGRSADEGADPATPTAPGQE